MTNPEQSRKASLLIMDVTEQPIIIFYVIAALAACSAIAGYTAFKKRRSPFEGVLLGFFLGPIGVLLEHRFPYVQRPLIDTKAWNSLRSVMTYQTSGQEANRRRSRRMDMN